MILPTSNGAYKIIEYTNAGLPLTKQISPLLTNYLDYCTCLYYWLKNIAWVCKYKMSFYHVSLLKWNFDLFGCFPSSGNEYLTIPKVAVEDIYTVPVLKLISVHVSMLSSWCTAKFYAYWSKKLCAHHLKLHSNNYFVSWLKLMCMLLSFLVELKVFSIWD